MIDRGSLRVTRESDIYMLGCTILELRQCARFVPFYDGDMMILQGKELFEECIVRKFSAVDMCIYNDCPDIQTVIRRCLGRMLSNSSDLQFVDLLRSIYIAKSVNILKNRMEMRATKCSSR